MRTRTFLAVGSVFAVAACTAGDGGNDTLSKSGAAATADVAAAPVVYPYSIPLTPEIEAAALAASAVSASQDKKCDLMTFSAAQQALRVAGKGCPRPPANEEGAK